MTFRSITKLGKTLTILTIGVVGSLVSGCAIHSQSPIKEVAYDFSDADFYDKDYAPSPNYESGYDAEGMASAYHGNVADVAAPALPATGQPAIAHSGAVQSRSPQSTERARASAAPHARVIIAPEAEAKMTKLGIR